MEAAETPELYADDPDNLTLNRLIDDCAGFGMSQHDVAKVLRISPGQLSRVRKGERHATLKHIRGLRTHLRTMTSDRASRESPPVTKSFARSVFSINSAILRALTPASAVEAFRELLWARAGQRGVPSTRIHVPADSFSADGGVDGSILQVASPIEDDDLLSSGTRYQIKTGDFRPWQPATIRRELFGSKAEEFQNLGAALQQLLCEQKRFVLVCFGVDPTDEDLRAAQQNLLQEFSKCGYPNPNVEVWGQSQLIGLFDPYPSLCLRLRGHDHQGFRAWRSWAGDADMLPTLRQSPERQLLVEELRDAMRSGDVAHLRLLGEPGVGKTRFALELTRAEDFAPLTLYVKDSHSLLHSSFINEIIHVDARGVVVLVIDECPPKDRADIWNIVKPKSNRIRIITIDHGPDDSVDEKMRVVDAAPAGEGQIVEILKDHGLGESDAKRWAEYCDGCPRVAHVLGENLAAGRQDLLKAPGTIEVWERFINGYDEPDSEEAELRRTVLGCAALFERFGFEQPVENEARFIAALAEKCDSRLTWPRFRSIIFHLKQRRIVQGTTTLYITPRLLHVHLNHEFWKRHGSSFDMAEAMRIMPRPLWNWFANMLSYAHDVDPAERAVDRLLGPRGVLPSDAFPNDPSSGELIRVLAEAAPKPALRCLQRTIGTMPTERLRKLTEPRHSLVTALERIAVWKDCFIDGADLLLRLAEAENESYRNNASGTFKSLFSLVPGMAATEAPPMLRLPVLQEALTGDSATRRRLGLEACAEALSTATGFRFVGPEHQGLRKRIEFWYPRTYGELWDAYRAVWQLVVDTYERSTGEDRRLASQTLISAAWSVLHVEPLMVPVVSMLKSLATDPATDVKALVELLKRKLRHPNSEFPPGIAAELKAVCDGMDGQDFPTRLRRVIKHVTHEDSYDGDRHDVSIVENKIRVLASDALANDGLLKAELGWLVCEDSSQAYTFAYYLGAEDRAERLLPEILSHQEAAGGSAQLSLLAGYLNAIYRRDEARWETVMETLAENPCVAARFSDLVIASGISDKTVRMVVTQCRQGKQAASRLARWWFANSLQSVSQDVFLDLVKLQLDAGSADFWGNAVQICDTYFLRNDSAAPLPEAPIFELLTHQAMAHSRAAHSAGYSWSRLASEFLKQYPARKWDFFRGVLSAAGADGSTLLDLNTNEEQVLTTLVRENPEEAWRCIRDAYGERGESQNSALQFWLADGYQRSIGDDSPGPIQHIPAPLIFAWVDENVDKRGYWMAHVLPKTLDRTTAGRLTRDFLCRYGRNAIIAEALVAHFHSRGWCGKTSDHYRRLRGEARSWLAEEKDANVIRWIDAYIDGLDSNIDREEIQEERQ